MEQKHLLDYMKKIFVKGIYSIRCHKRLDTLSFKSAVTEQSTSASIKFTVELR